MRKTKLLLVSAFVTLTSLATWAGLSHATLSQNSDAVQAEEGTQVMDDEQTDVPVESTIALPQDADGWYVLSTPQDLMTLASAVNSGEHRNVNVRLANDIDMAGIENYVPIGCCNINELNYAGQDITNPGFAGTFDGQGHEIQNLMACYDAAYAASGVFGTITGTVKNLGVRGYYFDNGAAYGGRFGALCGQLVEGHILNCYVTECTVFDTNEIVSGIAAGNYGGLVEGCYEYGNNIQPYPRAGHLVGDNRDDNSVRQGRILNCVAEGHVSGTGCPGGYEGGQTNCLSGITEEQMISGMGAYVLNGGLTTQSAWRQDIDGDEVPVLDPTHGFVFLLGEDYINLYQDHLSEVCNQINAAELDWNANVVCCLTLTDAYEAMVNALLEVADLDEFLSIYEALMNKKSELQASAEAYATYKAKVDEVSAYLKENVNFAGEDRLKLEDYLNESYEPCDDYANGSYPYIIETRLLDNETLALETANVQAMLDKAIENGYKAGAEITNLLVNPDLANGTEGWQTDMNMGITNVADASVQHVGLTTDKGTLSQTVKGLLPGIYEVRVNAAYCSNSDELNLNQASFVFANNNKVYTSTLLEGALPADVEIDHLDQFFARPDEDGEVIAYIPTNSTAFAYAFSAGYYENIIVAEVGEDGELTFGVNTPGCMKTNHTWVGNFRVFYCGEKGSDTANEATARALACQGARLNSLANDYLGDESEFTAAPNYSQALKNKVMAAAEAYETSNVEALGDLMQRVYDCKMAYATMMAQAEVLLDLSSLVVNGLIDEAESLAMEEQYVALGDAYMDGTFSTEEALSQNPLSKLSFAPQIVDNVAQLSKPMELLAFSSMVSSGAYRNLNAVLLNDIDMSGMSYYLPIGYCSLNELNYAGQSLTNPGYAGVFDGQGHEIQNLQATYNAGFASSGVFGTVTGTVKNLGVRGYYFDNGAAYAGRFGALCGQLVEGHILNCYVTECTVFDTNEIVSGIAAANYGGLIENCYEYGNNIQPYPRAGHLVGDNRDDNNVRLGRVVNCYSEGFVTGEGRSGGYVGGQEDCESNISAARFQSGEIAYKLNGNQDKDVTWYQSIFQDMSPLLDASHLTVHVTANGLYTNFDAVNAELLAMTESATALADSTQQISYNALVTDANQLSENCLWQAGYEISHILDGDPMTFFHSRIDLPLEESGEYMQINLNEPVESFYLEFTGRGDGMYVGAIWHDTPNRIRIEGSNTPEDEESWSVITIEEYDFPYEHYSHYMSPEPIQLGAAYSSIRIYILNSDSGQPYWNLSQFQMYSAVTNPSIYDTDANVKAAADAVLALAAELGPKAKVGDATEADWAAMRAAYDALLEALGRETAIENVADAQHSQDNAIYTLTGVRVDKANAQRGIYIMNGKKVLVK